MKKRFYSLLFSLLLCGNLVSSASVSITGKSRMQTGDTTEYSVNPETDITSYVWKAPKGCHIIDGQGSPTIKLASTFLSQDSPLTLIRGKNDNSTDTSSIDISFVHRIARISDHSISAGDSISINGTYYKDADIYYEPLSDGDGEYQQVTAHRLTVVPDTFSAFTKRLLRLLSGSVGRAIKPAYRSFCMVPMQKIFPSEKKARTNNSPILIFGTRYNSPGWKPRLFTIIKLYSTMKKAMCTDSAPCKKKATANPCGFYSWATTR